MIILSFGLGLYSLWTGCFIIARIYEMEHELEKLKKDIKVLKEEKRNGR